MVYMGIFIKPLTSALTASGIRRIDKKYSVWICLMASDYVECVAVFKG